MFLGVSRARAEESSFTEAFHLAKAPSVRKEELFILSALWLSRVRDRSFGGSQNRKNTGALKPVQKPDSFGIAVKALAKSRVQSPELSRLED
jgi:hypothetical protein